MKKKSVKHEQCGIYYQLLFRYEFSYGKALPVIDCRENSPRTFAFKRRDVFENQSLPFKYNLRCELKTFE